MKAIPTSPNWKAESDEHDYPAAINYLSLICEPDKARKIVSRIKKSPIMAYLAKDILRASRLQLLPPENYHVKKYLKKVKRGGLLSPVLLVRGNFLIERTLIIADGYHRVCASYHLDENSQVLCHMVSAEIADKDVTK